MPSVTPAFVDRLTRGPRVEPTGDAIVLNGERIKLPARAAFAQLQLDARPDGQARWNIVFYDAEHNRLEV